MRYALIYFKRLPNHIIGTSLRCEVRSTERLLFCLLENQSPVGTPSMRYGLERHPLGRDAIFCVYTIAESPTA